MKQLNIKNLRPHLGDLNWVLKDYGISIEVTCNENGDVALDENNKPKIKIGTAHEWIDETGNIVWKPNI